MKTCSGCARNLPETDFHWKRRDEVRHSRCKDCQRASAKKHYDSNPQYYIDKARRAKPEVVARSKAFILDWLKTHPCVDCGETDIEVLEFDHREMVGPKAPRVWGLLTQSLARIQREIDLCDVRCANCHTRRTRRQMGWTRADVQLPGRYSEV